MVQNAGGMAHDEIPDKRLLVADLKQLAQIGYRVGRTRQIAKVELLVRLRMVGGPDLPSGPMEWHKRRESIRALLGSIADTEVPKVLDEKYAEATRTLFRLDKPRPLETQSTLNELQAELSEFFGETDDRGFLKHHRELLLEVIADALIQRETEATPADELEEQLDEEASTPASEDEDQAAAAPPPEPIETEPSASPPILPPARDLAPETDAPQSRRLSWTAGVMIGVLSLIAVAALVLLVIRNQPSESEEPKAATAPESSTAPQERATPEPASATPREKDSVASGEPTINFTAEVVKWCYCGDFDTQESQIKMKPRFANHSARKVDLRTGGSARLGLAFYAKSSSDRSWITPTEPRYRRYGKWIVVPPNAPGDLTNPTMFETHWEPTSLRPFGEYLDPDFYEGDLVFNVPPNLSVGGYRVRLAYRLRSGDLYFPRKGAAGQWRGYEKEGSTF
jgi:hypothetical protein